MPLMRCTKNGKNGYKYGQSGSCYTGSDAKKKALRQAAAMYANGYKSGKTEEDLGEMLNILAGLSK